MTKKLTETDHRAMARFLARVLDAYKEGNIDRGTAIGGLAHVMAALDQGNTSEAVSWFNQDGISYFKNAQ